MMIVNGKEFYLEKDMTLEEFLIEAQFSVKQVAVERNGDIVPKSEFQSVQLKQEDHLEVVSFVGGG